MSLELLFREGGEPAGSALLLPQLPGTGIEPLVAAILDAARGRRRIFPDPGPEDSAATVRGWHRDLWWALPESERRALVLATGPGVACLREALDAGANLIAVVREPLQAIAALPEGEAPKRSELEAFRDEGAVTKMRRLRAFSNRQARALLAPWSDADDLPVTLGPPADAERWRALLFDRAVSGLQIVRADDLPALALLIAKRLGCPPKRTMRVAEELARPQAELHGKPGRAELLGTLNWLDRELYDRSAAKRHEA